MAKNKENKKPKKKRKFSIIRFILLLILITMFIGAGALAGIIAASVRNAPEIDPTIILSLLNKSSVIVDENNNIIEEIQAFENREIVDIETIPDHVEDAFIAIEDQRFRTHIGVDPKRIIGAMIHNIKVGDLRAQGGSTITQQLAKNLYLSNVQEYDRKIKEAYLAIEMERKLTKNQILEYYLNTIDLGQSTQGVQSASWIYFSKDVSELTIAESALLAAIPKSPPKYSPYYRIESSEDYNYPQEDIVGYTYISGTKYTCFFNETSIDRQKLVLSEMLDNGFISQEEYDEALSQDIKASLNPGQYTIEGISSSFTDYVKSQVIQDLMEEYDYTYEEAQHLLFTGGLKIYCTMDLEIQKILENSYDNFAELLTGSVYEDERPLAQSWKYFNWLPDGESSGSLGSNDDILNENGYVIYFKKENILDENGNIIITNDEFEYDESGNLLITSKKFNIYSTVIDIVDYYTIDDRKNLVTHKLSGLNIGENYEIINKSGIRGTIKISEEYLSQKPDIIMPSENGLIISKDYFTSDTKGIVQPQSAAIIMDYKTGKIKALVGGRNITESKSFNRAVNATRQPGSTIKPLSLYLPALDNGYTAASIIDDVPRYNEDGERWPKNWYEDKYFKYWGLTTLRKSVEFSMNINAVKMLEMLGYPLAQEYLGKLNLINFDNPEDDNFITSEENRAYNDVNLASLALGGLTKGFTPLDMTAAYGAIANDGVYVEPISYSKVVDSNGSVVLEKIPKSNVVVTPQVAFILKDILRTTVTNGLSWRAYRDPDNPQDSLKDLNIEIAGKTGTTQNNTDIWYVGFSPYYVGGIWIGNDDSQLKLREGSGNTSRFWGNIMKEVHKDLPPTEFEEVEGLHTAHICAVSGKLATDLCEHDPRGSQVRKEYFLKGTKPVEVCDVHVKANICTFSNKLPNQYCPLDNVEERVFITRNIPYDPYDYPETKDESYETLKASRDLYKQVLEEMRTSNGAITQSAIEMIYGNSIEFENGEIIKVNGFTIDDLNYEVIIPEDYQYQLPVDECTAHNSWHWLQWINNMNSTGQGIDVDDDNVIDDTNEDDAESQNDTTNLETEESNSEEEELEVITN